ncbi:MAG: hypothetical protein RJA49_2447, partial [Actinomycetota bacterium]
LLAWSLYAWWDYGWRSAAHRKGRIPFAALPLLSIPFGLVQVVLALISVDDVNGTMHVTDGWAAVIACFGQLKWLVLFLGWCAYFLTVYGAWRFRGLTFEPADATDEVPHSTPIDTTAQGSAICLSGGGIRSASFAWGALAELERRRPLKQFDRLYTVSGGGYTGAAYTSAPDELRDADRFYSDAQVRVVGDVDSARFEYVRAHQRYLENGPGGFVRALGLALASVTMNLFVVFLGVIVVSVPVGVLARGELGGPGTQVPPGVWRPVVVAFIIAGALLVLGALIDNGERRWGFMASMGMLAFAVIGSVIRIVMPWLAGNVEHVLSSTWWRNVLPAAIVWIGSLLLTLLKPRLAKVAARLGGLLTLAAIVLATAMVTRMIISPDWHWFGRSTFLDRWGYLLALAGALLVAVDYSGAQWWSLHPLYRNRLAGTFSLARDGGRRQADEIHAQLPKDWPTWTEVGARAVNRPQHVVCAATHRHSSAVTGLKSISFTFSSDGVEMHEPYREEETGAVTVKRYHQDASWFEHAIGAHRGYLSTKKRATVISAAAMSGAAVDSSMGRESMGSTDTLLALLNLRLGVWLPNPRFACDPTAERPTKAFTRPGLRYLFHEVIGHFDTTDPFIHVSDGGHWENLGLVEALRKRNERIVVIDASGDRFREATPLSLATGLGTLYEAVDLARIELFTEVKVDPEQFAMMAPDHRTGRCRRNWMTCDVVYHCDPVHDWEAGCDERCHHAQLLLVKALVSDGTPESVLSFANTDRVFPAYSTGDQFLTDAQFRSLVGLGEASMAHAVDALGADWFGAPTPS